MIFSYHPDIGKTFPKLFTGLVVLRDFPDQFDLTDAISYLQNDALRGLANSSESEMSAIKSWRTAFSTMGLKSTQYRCASEALLRRLRTHGELPSLNPLVDVCNAASAAHGVPVAAFDLGGIAGNLTVQPAIGDETYLTFGGTTEHPNPGEIIFADEAGAAHARRWTNRQSAASAVSPATRTALLIIEGLHDKADTDVLAARDALADVLGEAGATVETGNLRGGEGQFSSKGAEA